MKVGDKFTFGDHEVEVTRLRPGDEFDIELEFKGSEWFYPCRCWYRSSELKR